VVQSPDVITCLGKKEYLSIWFNEPPAVLSEGLGLLLSCRLGCGLRTKLQREGRGRAKEKAVAYEAIIPRTETLPAQADKAPLDAVKGATC
jgi:hypothetical protein